MVRITLILCIWLVSSLGLIGIAQSDAATFEPLGTNLWLGSYNKFRLTDKWFWRGEFHYRRGGYDGVPYIGRMAQIYNRHAISYYPSKTFNASFGVVLRLDFTPQPGNEDFEHVIPEPRFWHEYMWVIPIGGTQLYHRLRFEHRWSRTSRIDSDWIYRDRWRYKIYASIPLNKSRLETGTLFLNPDAEIIMQSGKTVGGSTLEDLRLYPSVGYIMSPQLTYTAGMMYTMGQRMGNPDIFRQRWVMRINAYISLDFRKQKSIIPTVRFTD